MIQKILRRNPSGRAATGSRAEIVRRWVETADERCPLACVWFAMPERRLRTRTMSPITTACLLLVLVEGRLFASYSHFSCTIYVGQFLKNQSKRSQFSCCWSSRGRDGQQPELTDDRPAKLPEAPVPADEAAATMFPHSETSRYLHRRTSQHYLPGGWAVPLPLRRHQQLHWPRRV